MIENLKFSKYLKQLTSIPMKKKYFRNARCGNLQGGNTSGFPLTVIMLILTFSKVKELNISLDVSSTCGNIIDIVIL